MTDMISELQRQAINPPAGDERIAAFSQAFVHYASTPEGEDWLGIIEGRKFEAVSYGANLLLRAVQKQLLPQDAYPYEYDEESAWHEAFVSIANNTQSACQLRHDLETKVTQSNVVERYKAFKLTMELAAPVISGAPTILDVGCSRNHGLKKLALNLPFKHISCGVDGTGGVLSNTLADRLMNVGIDAPRIYGRALGIDLIDPQAPDNGLWAKSCSFYPSELLNKDAEDEYDYLESVQAPGVETAQASVLDPDLNQRIGQFDVITVSTFMYQLSPVERGVARTALRGLLSDKGVIVYQDFTRRNRDKNELHFEDSWFASVYPYRTLVEVPIISGDRIYEIFRWSNGRCQKWVPGKDLDDLINTIKYCKK